MRSARVTVNVHVRESMSIEVVRSDNSVWVTMEDVTFFPNHFPNHLKEADLAELLAEMRDWGQQIVDQANVLLEEKENH